MRIAVALDRRGGWHERFATALDIERARDPWFEFELVNLDRHDWIRALGGFDAVLWKSNVMGAVAASHFKEKIYFVEHYLQKLVFPNYETIWHFESKVAQSYIFELLEVPRPTTTVTFEPEDAHERIAAAELPLVFKLSAGAGSSNVWRVASREEAISFVERTFAHELFERHVTRNSRLGRVMTAARFLTKTWARGRLVDRLRSIEPTRPLYFQRFVEGNAADLRITVIGGRYAIGYWRNNRPNDFRASGSGLLDFERPVPPEIAEACVRICDRCRFDSMAFDVLFAHGQFVIVEMSYAYVDEYVANSRYAFERTQEGSLVRAEPGRWPQELWVSALLTKLRSGT